MKVVAGLPGPAGYAMPGLWRCDQSPNAAPRGFPGQAQLEPRGCKLGGDHHEHPRVSGQGDSADLRRAGLATAWRCWRPTEARRRSTARGSGLGGEGADPRRRPRQGHVQGEPELPARRAACASPRRRPKRRRRVRGADARQHAGHASDRPRRQAGEPRLHRGRRGDRQASSTCRCWSTARPAGSRSSSRPRAAWTSRRSRPRRPRRS